MTKRMQSNGFKISERKDGSYRIVLNDSLGGHYETIQKNFKEAGLWVWNMADNHQQAKIVNHRMCEVFNKDFA